MKKEECNHKWIHLTKIDLNMKNKKCSWLVHICEKCGLETNGIFIFKESKKEQNKTYKELDKFIKESKKVRKYEANY